VFTNWNIKDKFQKIIFCINSTSKSIHIYINNRYNGIFQMPDYEVITLTFSCVVQTVFNITIMLVQYVYKHLITLVDKILQIVL